LKYALIFDMDGVIADTVEPHYRSWQRLADEEGVPFTRERNDGLLGRTREEALDVLLDGRTLEVTERQAWLQRKQRYFLQEIASFGPGDALPGVLSLLAEARDAGVPVGLASSSRNVNVILARLGIRELFGAVADGSVVRNAKPAPDIFVWVAGRLGVAPRDCVVFEDAPAGVRAALDGGFRVVGLGDPARVKDAHLILPNLRGARLADFAALVGAPPAR